VLSTLHTNDAPGAVLRLVDMGIEPFMAASSIVGVIAQRLVKRICTNCKYEYAASDEELEILGINGKKPVMLYKGKGCAMCNKTGYKGRLGVYEIMTITGKHRELINKRCTEDELKSLSLATGMVTLKENAKSYVLEGRTTLDEMLRIAFSNE
jgi:type IV pilus assembly protein PilB